MATFAKTIEDITLVISIDDPDANELLEADIVDEDNNSPSCYVPNVDYYVRLYRSSEDLIISAKMNFGNITLANPSVQENLEETIIFTGGESASTNRIIQSNFVYSMDGQAFDLEHNEYTSVISHTIGSKNLRIEGVEGIFGVVNVSYITRYMHYIFRPSRIGKLIISFVVI